MVDALRGLIRASAFLGKEISEVLRQPRLMLTLALGPFLILLLFGLAFRNEPRDFRTLFVAPENDKLSQQIEEYATTIGPQLIFAGVISSEAAARERLRRGEVDLVIVVPADAEETIRRNEQAVFVIYHDAIDPQEAAYIEFFGQLYVSAVNRRIVQSITAEGQGEAATVQDEIAAARLAATAAREALEQGDASTARQEQSELDRHVSALELAVAASLGLLRGVEQTVGVAGTDETSQAIVDQLSEVRTGTNSLSTIEDDGDLSAEAAEAAAVEERLASLEASLAEFTSLEPHIVVSPFRSETYSVASVQPDVTSYYAPGVLALLLQHMAVTFGALSLVRERVTGSVELFRVSPISSGEVLAGKYAAHLVFGGLLAALLTVLLRWLLDVPMVGNWVSLALAIGLLLVASLGVGFVISLLSHTASQAVQLSMLVLLASVFFSGFFVAPWLLWPEARALTWTLPVTYGIQMLQMIMLRGEAPAFALTGGLLLIALLAFVWTWVLTRRLMAPR